jgi:hypothetical protein
VAAKAGQVVFDELGNFHVQFHVAKSMPDNRQVDKMFLHFY